MKFTGPKIDQLKVGLIQWYWVLKKSNLNQTNLIMIRIIITPMKVHNKNQSKDGNKTCIHLEPVKFALLKTRMSGEKGF